MISINSFCLIKRNFTVFSFLLFIGFSCSVEQPDNTLGDLQPTSLDIPQKEGGSMNVVNAELNLLNRWIDFGNVSRDTLLVARYNFTNSGTDTLTIHSVEPDCIFKDYTLNDEIIAPGDSAYVLLELDTARIMPGYVRSYATIETNAYTKFYNIVFETVIE